MGQTTDNITKELLFLKFRAPKRHTAAESKEWPFPCDLQTF